MIDVFNKLSEATTPQPTFFVYYTQYFTDPKLKNAFNVVDSLWQIF